MAWNSLEANLDSEEIIEMDVLNEDDPFPPDKQKNQNHLDQ